jgi:Ubiquitin fusion degradation protein UFD1
MPTNLYSLLYHETLPEAEIEGRECSNGIYVSSTRFSGLNYGTNDNEMVILKLTHGSRSVLAHITSIHTGESSVMYAPTWMCMHLGLDEGDNDIVVERVHPALGSKITIQPYTSEYTKEVDPVGALRNAFEHYSCLDAGQSIPLIVGQNRVYVDIIGTNSDGPICIRGLEIEVEIARPLDEPEPEPEVAVAAVPTAVATHEPMVEEVKTAIADTRFPGTGYRLGSKI